MLLHATGGAEPDTPHADPPAPGRDFGRIAAFAARLLDTPLSVLSLVEEERPYTCGAPGDAWQRRLAAPLSRTLCGVAVRTGSVVLAEDARDLPAVLADPEMWLGEVGYAGIPFHHADGRVAGALSVADQRRRAWTPEEVELLASLAHFAALLVRSEDRGRTLDGVLAAAAGSAGRGVSLRMLRKAVETMQLGVTITDLSGRILYSNPADARMHGYEAGELEGADARILAPPEQARPLQPQRLEEVRSWSRETVNVRKDGTRFPVLLRSDLVTDPAGRPVALVTCCEDLTHRKALEQELLRNAFYDPVTRLPNSGLLRHRLDLTMDAARREERRFAVVGIELDRVQLVRDSLGREAGEDLLRAAGERLRECSPPEAMLAHVAQDQFVVLVEPPQALDAATRVAACVRGMLHEPFLAGGRDVFTGASVGVVLCGPEYTRADDVLRDAAIAVVRAREAGDGQYQVFDPAMHAAAMDRLDLENDLRRALERGELRVHYQPIVRLDTGSITGFEALARWEHPERGLLLPDEFVPLAEETGLILPIGLAVLEEACRTLAGWQQRPGCEDLRMAVNLSPRQFAQPDLVRRVQGVLARTGVTPGTLELEITESVILQHSPRVMQALHRLKALGVGLHVDDFGTGYSSLAYLHRLPLDALKIDRSFISGSEPNGLQIVRTIVAMAQALGVAVIGEGIETAELLGELRGLSCEYGQGYFFARPAAAEEIEALFRDNPSW
jgi:PAS domain S-box-containing protein/diguanylate cyclase (GGDEF)-like protein